MTDPVVPPAAPAPAPAAAGVKQTLSLTSFILGLASLVFGWVPVLGFLAGLAAIIIGAMSRKREPAAPSWMRIIGIIAGIVGIVVGIIFLIVTIFVTLLPLWAGTAAVNSVY
jgi:hypothetical protein